MSRVRPAVPRAKRQRAGFALLAVVWGVGLISMLVVAFLTSGRLRLQTAVNIASATEAGFIAESAINLSVLRLLAQRDVAPSPTTEIVYDGAPKFCVLDRAAVAVALEEEAGKIDLNGASPEFLEAALVGLGVNARKARDVAQAIVAYRTAPSGGFGQITLAPPSDKPIPPKQGLFETVMELDQVGGVDPALFRALLPFVTVQSRTAGVDARSSPPALFAALSGYPAENVRALAAAPFPNNLKRNDPRFPANFNQAGDRGAFLIHAEVMLATGQTIARDAILDLRPSNGAQFALREIRLGQSKYGDRLRATIASNGAGVPDC